MISFYQFLRENFEWDDKLHMYDHVTDVGGKKVHLTFTRDYLKQGRFAVDFAVNASSNKSSVYKDPRTLYHVSRTVHEFIQKHNPSRLSFQAGDINSKHQAK